MSGNGSTRPDSPGATAAKLLRAASELVGGNERLAHRLHMSPLLLRKYMAGRDELPPHLLLRTVDLILEEREARLELDSAEGVPPPCGGSDASGPPA